MARQDFDAVVIGAGHAGVEAAAALGRRGFRTALVSFDKLKVGAMSCNPAIGGVAKSHLVFEVDALGGLMGQCGDLASIQSKRLNLKKGPAVRSTRSQCDKDFYARTMSSWMSSYPNVDLIEGEVAGFHWGKDQAIESVTLKDGSRLKTRCVILTAGTFMRAVMFMGDERNSGGRLGDKAASTLSQSIEATGHSLTRLKTGTPARLDSRTIDYSKLEQQWGDPERRRFSWKEPKVSLPQVCCYMTYTNERTHEVIRANFSRSALFSGDIQGVGPRYCPSVEDKIKRFPDRARHQVFLEPEGVATPLVYPNGMSTSLPVDVQLDFLRTMQGLENVELLKPGYAVEYDCLDPTELHYSFMSKNVSGLFTGGQVNRTSGYEEAASQGLWAGIQASLWLEESEFLKPDRSRSYMETLVDDLSTVGSLEPYRMFTSRSEYRLHLREDNAPERMHELGIELGLLSEEQKVDFDTMRKNLVDQTASLSSRRVRLDKDRVVSVLEVLKRPESTWESLELSELDSCDDRVLERIEVEAKYSGYLKKQEAEIRELRAARSLLLDPCVSLRGLSGLSEEVIEKYEAHRPESVFELSRISGITPAAVLLISRAAGKSSQEDVSRET